MILKILLAFALANLSAIVGGTAGVYQTTVHWIYKMIGIAGNADSNA